MPNLFIATALFLKTLMNSAAESTFILCTWLLMPFLLQLLVTCCALVLSQIITYRDYLPLLLAEEISKWIPLYSGYNEKVDPRASNVFSLAFRFGHTLVQPFVSRLNESFQPLGSSSHVPLHLTFCAPWRIVTEGKNMKQWFCSGVEAEISWLGTWNCRIPESFRLQKIPKIIKSNLWLSPCQPAQSTVHHVHFLDSSQLSKTWQWGVPHPLRWCSCSCCSRRQEAPCAKCQSTKVYVNQSS